MNYSPLGTRAFDHFILEYDRQARSRGWDTTFGFIADPPASMAQLQWFRYDLPWTAGNDRLIADCAPDVVQTSFHSAFEKPIHTLKEKGLTKRLLIIDHSGSPTGVTFCQFSPPFLDSCTSPSSEPAHKTPASSFDSATAKIVP